MDKPIFKYVPRPELDAILHDLGTDMDTESSFNDPKMNKPIPYSGTTFAIKNAQGEMKSLFIVDNGLSYEESLAKKILDACRGKDLIVEKGVHFEKGTGVYYIIPLHLPEHFLFKPTVCEPISKCCNVDSDVTIEVVFALGDGFVFPVYLTEKTGGTGSMSVVDFMKDILSDIEDYPEEFFQALTDDGYPCELVKEEDKVAGLRIFCSAAAGDSESLYFEKDDLRHMYENIVSIRMVELNEKITS